MGDFHAAGETSFLLRLDEADGSFHHRFRRGKCGAQAPAFFNAWDDGGIMVECASDGMEESS